MTVVINELRSPEFEELSGLIDQQQLYHYNLNTPNSERFLGVGVKEFRDYMTKTGAYACYAAYDASTPVGFIACTVNKNKAFIEDVFVTEEYRGKGIGSKLMTFLLDFCYKENTESISVHITNNNEKVFGFYKKYGFSEDHKDETGYIFTK